MNGFTENFSINKKRNFFLKFFIGIIIFVFAVFILNFGSAVIKNTFYTASLPVQNILWSAGASSSNYISSVFKANFLASENENLKNQNQKLLLQVAALQAITAGNQAQSNVSLACQNNNFTTVMAGVVGLDAQDILSVNKGLADGISENMPVINQQGVVFGKIFKVFKNFSEVMLISNKDSVVNVKVQQSDTTKPEIEGVAKGAGGLAVNLELVPISDTINQGDVLVTSAIEKIFPKDLLVGTITNIQKNDQKPFQQAQIQPYFDIKTADNLFIITNYKQN